MNISVGGDSGRFKNKGDLTSRFHAFLKNEVSKSKSSIVNTHKTRVFSKGIKLQLLDILMEFKHRFENNCTGSGEFKPLKNLKGDMFEVSFKELVHACLDHIGEKSGSKDVKQQKIKFLNSVLGKLDLNNGELCKFRHNPITDFLNGEKLLISSEVTLEKNSPIIDTKFQSAIDDAQKGFNSLNDLLPQNEFEAEVNDLMVKVENELPSKLGLTKSKLSEKFEGSSNSASSISGDTVIDMEELQAYFDSLPDFTYEQQRFIDKINTYTTEELEELSQQLIEDSWLKANAFDKFIAPLQEPKHKDITGMNDKELAAYNAEHDAYDKAFWEAQENYCNEINILFEKPPEVTKEDLDEEFAKLDAHYLGQEDDVSESSFQSDISSSLGHTTDDASLSSSPSSSLSSSPSSSLSSSPSPSPSPSPSLSLSPSPVSSLHSKDQKSKNIYKEISDLIELNSKLFNVIDQDLSQMKTSFQSSVGDYNKLLRNSKDKKNDSHMNKRLNMYKQGFTNTKNCLHQLWMIQKKSLGKK